MNVLLNKAEAPQVEHAAWPAPPPVRHDVQVGLEQTHIDEAGTEQAAAQFARSHAIQLGSLLSGDLLRLALRLGALTRYEGSRIAGARDVESDPQPFGRTLNLALNRPVLREWMSHVTGCGPLSSIEGRVARMTAGSGDFLEWHDDDVHGEGRRLALVITLASVSFTGGEFQMRLKTGEPLFERREQPLNTALLFAVDPRTEHRVLPIRSGGPRVIYAGWAFSKQAE